MKITSIRITHLRDPRGKTRAFVEVILDNELALRNLRVVETPRGYFVAMPSIRRRDGTFCDIVIPLTSELQKSFQTQVLRAYLDEMAQQKSVEGAT